MWVGCRRALASSRSNLRARKRRGASPGPFLEAIGRRRRPGAHVQPGYQRSPSFVEIAEEMTRQGLGAGPQPDQEGAQEDGGGEGASMIVAKQNDRLRSLRD